MAISSYPSFREQSGAFIAGHEAHCQHRGSKNKQILVLPPVPVDAYLRSGRRAAAFHARGLFLHFVFAVGEVHSSDHISESELSVYHAMLSNVLLQIGYNTQLETAWHEFTPFYTSSDFLG